MTCDRGPPLISKQFMGRLTAGAAGRCHCPGVVSPVAAGTGPYLRPDAVSPLFHHLPAPVQASRRVQQGAWL